MAEVGKEEASSENALCLGSDNVFEFYCQLCYDNGQTIEAVWYCKNCKEYLCRDCTENHRKSSQERHHVLVITETTKKFDEMFVGTEREIKRCSKICQNHQEVIRYFCTMHNEIACITCITTRHNVCTDVKFIPDISSDFPQSEEYGEMKKVADETITTCERVSLTGNHNASKVESLSATSKDILRYLRQDLNDTIDRLESEIESKLEFMRQKDARKTKATIDTSSSIIQNVKLKVNQLEMLESSEEYPDLFTETKKFGNELKKLNDKATENEDENSIIEYTFHPNEGLWDMLQRSDILGKIVHQPGLLNRCRQLFVKHFRDIDVRSKSDKDEAVITGSVLINNKLVVWDIDNCHLKVIDMQTNKLVCKKLSLKLWDLTHVNDNKIAATVPLEETVVLVTISNDNNITEERRFLVDGHCRGIAYSRAMFIVTFEQPPKVELLDINGIVLWSVSKGGDREQLFCEPFYVAVYSDLHQIFVSDYKKNSIIKMNFKGNVTHKYFPKNLRAPTKPVVDDNGNVFCGGCDSNNILMISENESKCSTILSEIDQINKPQSISYCPKSKLLYVGMEMCNWIKVFQFS